MSVKLVYLLFVEATEIEEREEATNGDKKEDLFSSPSSRSRLDITENKKKINCIKLQQLQLFSSTQYVYIHKNEYEYLVFFLFFDNTASKF